MLVVKTRRFGRFWPVSWTITLFCGLRVISTIDEPRVRLRVGHEHSHIQSILLRFMHYYSVFLGHRAIFAMDEPRVAFMCPSSTLIVLANSDPFRGLLLTVLGSRSDLHSCRTPRCTYVSVINTHHFAQFWSVSWTITHRFGVPERFPRFTIPGVRLRARRQHS